MEENTELAGLQPTPFENIALAFSGGGFRAASFSLGVMGYLYQLENNRAENLLGKVTFISSASGGTITNACYALSSVKQDHSFPSFFKGLYENLKETDLLDTVLDKLNNDKEWVKRKDKRRNLINAFSLVYNEKLFDGAVLGELYRSDSPTHLEEVCFNTTEFYKGLLFRQNIKLKFDAKFREDRGFRFGNSYVNLPFETAKRLKIADLLAASSCFPGGFEPIIFPDDFTYSPQEEPAGKQLEDLPSGELTSEELVKGMYVRLQELSRPELVRLFGEKKVDEIISASAGKGILEIEKAFAGVEKNKNFNFGMMDGGITDNQALESLMQAHDRRLDGRTDFKPFDLMLINDVGSHFMEPYVLNKDNNPYAGVKGISINNILFISGLLGIAGIAGVGLFGWLMNRQEHSWLNWVVAFASSALILVSALVFTIILTLKQFIKGKVNNKTGLDLDKNFSPRIVEQLFQHFGATPVMIILVMLKERFNSVLTLNSDVFLKRIRFLLYNMVFDQDDPDSKNKKYRFRIKTNHVYDLAYANDLYRVKNDEAQLTPAKTLQDVAQAAFEMGTTLWFDKKNSEKEVLPALIACGHFTTCYNLLEYILRMKTVDKGNNPSYYSQLTPEARALVDDLQFKLQRDYAAFNQDPFWLFKENIIKFGMNPVYLEELKHFSYNFKDFKGLR